MFIPQPLGLAFEEWSSILTEQYSEQGMPEGIPAEDQWKEWGTRIREVDALNQLPDTREFATWQAWAERVIEALAE